MTNTVVIIVILLILTASASKIIVEKRKGSKCMGCPYGKPGASQCSCQDD